MAKYYAHKPSFRRASGPKFDVYYDAGGGNISRRTIDIAPSGYSGGRHGELPRRGFNGKFTRDLRDTTFGKAKNTAFDPKRGGYTNKLFPVGKAQAWANLLIPAGQILFEAWDQAGRPLPGWISDWGLDYWITPGSEGAEYPTVDSHDNGDGTYTSYALQGDPLMKGQYLHFRRYTYEHRRDFIEDGVFYQTVVREYPSVAEWSPQGWLDDPHFAGSTPPSEWSPWGYQIIPGWGDGMMYTREGAVSGYLHDIHTNENTGYLHSEIQMWAIVTNDQGAPWVGEPGWVDFTQRPILMETGPAPVETISIGTPSLGWGPVTQYENPWPVWVVPRPMHPNDEAGYGQTPSTWPPVKTPTDPNTSGPPIKTPPYYPAPPTFNERERKYKFKPKLYGAYQLAREALAATTEAKDAVEAIWDALPGSVKAEGNEAKGLPEKFMDIYNNLDKVDWNEAIQNLIENHFEDAAIGRGLGALDRAAKRMGLPSGFRFENVAFEAFEWSLG